MGMLLHRKNITGAAATEPPGQGDPLAIQDTKADTAKAEDTVEITQTEPKRVGRPKKSESKEG